MKIKNIRNLLKAYTNEVLVKGDYNVRQNKQTSKGRTKRVLPILERKRGTKVEIRVFSENGKYEIADKESWLTLDAILSLFGSANLKPDAFVRDYGLKGLSPLKFSEGYSFPASINDMTFETLNNMLREDSCAAKSVELRKRFKKADLKKQVLSTPVIIKEISSCHSTKEKGEYVAASSKLSRREFMNASNANTAQLELLKKKTCDFTRGGFMPYGVTYLDKDFRDVFFMASLIGACLYPNENCTLNQLVTKVLNTPVKNIEIAFDRVFSLCSDERFQKAAIFHGAFSSVNLRIAVAAFSMGYFLIDLLSENSIQTLASVNRILSIKRKGYPSFRNEMKNAHELYVRLLSE